MTPQDLYKFLSDPDLVELIECVKISDDILDVINLTENQHSDMLAWCLNPNEGHMQGDAVIKDFLLAAYEASSNSTFDNKKFFAKWTPGCIRTATFGAAFVTREFGIKVKEGKRNGRLDLFLVDPSNKIIVSIENKAGATLTRDQLDRYYQSVKQEIGKRPAFARFDLAFVVLDRYLDSYRQDELDTLGTKWVIVDYSWLQRSANRARLHVERNNQAAQLLVAYCQKQTEWESPAESGLSELAAALSIRHESVITEMRKLRKYTPSSWTPNSLDGPKGELLLFINQHRQLCANLLTAHGIAAVVARIRAGLPDLRTEQIESSRTWLQFAGSGIEELMCASDDACWPIYINIFRETGNNDEVSKYTVRLIWCKDCFDEERYDSEVIRQHFLKKFAGLSKFEGSSVRRIVIGRKLNATEAVETAVTTAKDVVRLLDSLPKKALLDVV